MGVGRRAAVPLALAGGAALAAGAAPAFPQEAGGAFEELDRAAHALLERAGPSVVRVEVERTPRLRLLGVDREERDRLEGLMRNFQPREVVVAAGFVVGEPGLVATAADPGPRPSAIRVRFPKGPVREGALVGSDPLSGVVVLRVDPVEGAAPLTLSVREASPGRLSLLLAPEERSPAAVLRLGFVTDARRPFGHYDAWLVSSVPVGPGQVGAPLLDARGEVLGMAVAAREAVRPAAAPGLPGLPGVGAVPAATDPSAERSWRLSSLLRSRGDHGERPASFSTFVPAAEMRRIVDELKSTGRVRRGMLGVRLHRPEPFIREVVAGTPAEAAGVGAGDRVLSLDGVAVDDTEVLTAYLQRRAPGTRVTLALRDPGGAERTAEATLAELPPPPEARQLFNGISVQEADSHDASAAKFAAAAVPGAARVVATSVDEGSAAWAAGIRPGDWIVEIADRPILSERDFREATTGPAALQPSVRVVVYRRGEAERRVLVLQ